MLLRRSDHQIPRQNLKGIAKAMRRGWPKNVQLLEANGEIGDRELKRTVKSALKGLPLLPLAWKTLTELNEKSVQISTRHVLHSKNTDDNDDNDDEFPIRISADQKEIVRQVFSEKTEFVLEIETIEKMSEFRETHKQTTFYAAARWVFGLEQTRSIASRRKRKPFPHPPENLRTPEGHIVLSELLKRYDDHVHKSRRETCRLDCKDFASNYRLMAKVGRENARRKIEWHEEHGYWRDGFIYYDDEFDCPECQADQDNQ
ncbi:hypothetical protein BC567DRAFT_274535 [Phyllosticta citribraziliensis]